MRPGGEGSSGDPQSPGQSWGGGGTSLEHYPHPVAHSGTAAKDLNSVSRCDWGPGLHPLASLS